MMVGLINIPMIAQYFLRRHEKEPIVELHCRPETLAMLAQTIQVSPIPYPPGLSVSWRKGAIVRLCRFPLIATDHAVIGRGGFLSRPQRLAGDPNWIESLLKEQADRVAESKPGLDKSIESVIEAMEKREIGTSEFMDEEGRTPTDVLVKAMTDCDDTRAVAVFKLSHDGTVEVESNMRRFEILGMLQDTLRNMMMQ